MYGICMFICMCDICLYHRCYMYIFYLALGSRGSPAVRIVKIDLRSRQFRPNRAKSLPLR